MANVTGASLQPIYERLNSAPRYHPMEADTFADPCMEAGDMVEVTRGESSYQSPVHSTRLVWKKGTNIEISTGGKEKRDSVAKVSNRKYRAGSTGLRSDRYIHMYVDDQYTQMRSGLELTGSAARLYVDSKYDQMRSGLDLTSSSAALYVSDMYRQLKSGLDLTSSSAALYVSDMYRQLKSGLDLTSSSLSAYVNDAYAQLSSGLEMTSSSISAFVNDAYAQMSAGLEITSSSVASYVNSAYQGLSSGIVQTANSIASYVNSAYEGMSSGLVQTANSISSYVNSAYQGLSSGIVQTANSIASFVENSYTHMKSGIEQTADSISTYVSNAYTQMTTGLQQTASSLSAFVSNAYTRMKTGLSLSTNTAILYAKSAENAAQIIAHVNNASSNITIQADRIMLNGATSIANVLSVLNSGDVTISGDVYSTGTFHPNGISMAAGSSLSFAFGTGPVVTYTLGASNVPTMVVDASVSGNELTLTKLNGDTVTFSKAITLSGAWSDGNTGVFTFSASNQSRVTTITGVSLNGSATLNNNNKKQMNVPLKVEASVDSGEPATVYTQGAIPVNCTPVWNEGYDAAYDYVTWPGAIESNTEVTTFYVGAPKSDRSGAVNHTFQLSKGTPSADGGYVGISLDGVAVGRISITNWWNAGRDSVTVSMQATPGYGAITGTTASDVRNPTYLRAVASNGAYSDNAVQMVAGSYDNGKYCIDLYFGGGIIARADIMSVYYAGQTSGVTGINATVDAPQWSSYYNKFYSYGYAKDAGGNTLAVSTIGMSDEVTLDMSGSWSSGTKRINVKHGNTTILYDDITVAATADAPRWDSSQNKFYSVGRAKAGSTSGSTIATSSNTYTNNALAIDTTSGQWVNGEKEVYLRLGSGSAGLLLTATVTAPTVTLTGPTWDSNGVPYGSSLPGGTTWTPTARTITVSGGGDSKSETVYIEQVGRKCYILRGGWYSSGGTAMAGVDISGYHPNEYSNAAYSLTVYGDGTEKKKLYYKNDSGTYVLAGEYFWYFRQTYMALTKLYS